MKALPTHEMSWDEKLRTMEELWESLSQDEEQQFASPPWHEDEIREAVIRYEGGQEQPVEWAKAKSELRKRAE